MQREQMDFDVVIVGAGPAGLSSACHLKQIAKLSGLSLEVAVIEKASEIGAHILSGAIFDTRALAEIFPNWTSLGAPLTTKITSDSFIWLLNERQSFELPKLMIPKSLHNHQENYLISLGELCRWLGTQAEALGVHIFTGFCAESLQIEEDMVQGVIIGDMGYNASGEKKENFTPGVFIKSDYVLLCEGSRGHLGKQVIQYFKLDKGKDSQHYALGFKEIWHVPGSNSRQGQVIHTLGHPLNSSISGGGFIYYGAEEQITLGLICDLNYQDPYVDLYQEFQLFKSHPFITDKIFSGERISYGARALTKGGLNALSEMPFPGGFILGCNAGTLNGARIKGTHTAMKSGILAAESIMEALESGKCHTSCFNKKFKESWLYDELYAAKNFNAALHRYGMWMGGGFNYIDQNIFSGKMPVYIKDDAEDHIQLQAAEAYEPKTYPVPDGKITFDRTSSVYLSNIYHDEDQPCHLKLKDETIPIDFNLKYFDEPAQRYCPAGVYEIVITENKPYLHINAQNCIHCKTCDIKDVKQNIDWKPPEGGSGPNYSGM